MIAPGWRQGAPGVLPRAARRQRRRDARGRPGGLASAVFGPAHYFHHADSNLHADTGLFVQKALHKEFGMDEAGAIFHRGYPAPATSGLRKGCFTRVCALNGAAASVALRC